MRSLFQLDAEEREGAEQLVNERLQSVKRTAKRCLGESPARGMVDVDELAAIGYEALIQAVLDLMLGETAAFDWSAYITMRIRQAMRDCLAQVLVERHRCIFLDSDPQARKFASRQMALFDRALLNEGRRGVRQVLMRLEEKRRAVVILRFGFFDGRDWTYEEIGEFLGWSSAWSHQLMKGALKTLRHPMRSRKLRDYLDWSLGEYERLPEWSPD